MSELDVLARLANDLDAAPCRWALIGGHAVSARSVTRFTKDVDIAVSALGDDEAEAVIRHLLSLRYRVFALLENDRSGRLATVRMVSPVGERVVDLLFASSGLEPDVVVAASVVVLRGGLAVRVARTGHLIAMKLLSRAERRPQDDADLLALAAASDDAEVELARHACRLIVERGYHRERDLEGDLDRLLAGEPLH